MGKLQNARMGPAIPFRRRSNLPIAIGAIAIAVLAFAATAVFLNWQVQRFKFQKWNESGVRLVHTRRAAGR